MTDLASTILDPLAFRVAAALGPTSYDANHALAGVREAFQLLGLDVDRFDTPAWNPLGEIVRPGDFVLIKPNLVREFRETHGHHADCTVTHGGVIRAVVDYVFKALDGRGRIVIADAPHSDANFDEVAKITGLREIQELYRKEIGFEIEVYDLRPECADKVDGVIVGHRKLPGDPAGYTKVNLAQHSMFAEIEPLCHLLYGSEYDTSELFSHHRDGRHEFLISRSVLEADVIISVPKLKTHKKTGITVNMKNLVGINGNKNWLPHHREGTPSQGGDQFKDDAAGNKIERGVVAGFKRLFPLLGPLRPIIAGPIKAAGKRIFGDTNTNKIRSGNWYGNDTTWRMVIDLNRALHYFDAGGKLHDQPVRRFFSIVDGIIGGEGNGPLDPLAKPAGLILAGRNPVLVDVAAARMMGFEWRKLSMLRRALEPGSEPQAQARRAPPSEPRAQARGATAANMSTSPYALALGNLNEDSPHALALGVLKDEHPLANCGGADVEIVSNNPAYCGKVDAIAAAGLGFKPHFGWTGHLEWNGTKNEAGAVA